MAGEHEIILAAKSKLNEVGPGFCLAKWLQVTIHLHTGRTHSCHHPSPHHIPVEEIEADPSALHNTKFKVQQQIDMVNGKRPPECQYCWNVEDLPGDHYSDRYMKSADRQWAGVDFVDEIVEKTKRGERVNPRYVEVSFSNVCNFKCGYCSPTYSSKWTDEIDVHGPYMLESHQYNNVDYLRQTNQMPIHYKEYNPYVEAFWKWWPDLVKDLKVFRVTGGEPLLDKNTFKVMDMLLNETPNPELELSFNSNLGVPDALISKYITKINRLLDEKRIRRSVLYTSVDAHGKQAEYGRAGLDYDQWLKNVDRILTEVPSLKMTVMCTANILSITSFDKLLKDIYDLKIKHYNTQRTMPITIDMSILRWPAHYCVSILPPEYADLIQPALDYMISKQENENGNKPYKGFFVFEIEKMKRFVETIRHPINPAEAVQTDTARMDFVRFVDEHDSRRGTNFAETFPELLDFYKDYK